MSESSSEERSPLVSIIVPVYNVEHYLDACVESLLQQEYRNFELLLIDDGSQDGSPRLCDSWATKDPRIHVYHKENGGLSDARNFGLNHAHGAYIYFIDSDDIADVHLLSSAMAKIFETNADMLFFKYRLLAQDGGSSVESNDGASFPPEGAATAKEALTNLWTWRVPSHSWQYIARAELYQSVRFPTGKVMEDVATTYRVIGSAGVTYFLPRELYYYRIRNNSILGHLSSQFFLDALSSTIANDAFVRNQFPELLETELNWSIRFLVVNLFAASACRRQFPEGAYRQYQSEVLHLLRVHCRELGWKKINRFSKIRLIAIRCGLMPAWAAFSYRKHKDTR